MTNLADLLPAGGGQNNTEFVADGNISAGAPVILTSDGKAAAIGDVPLAINVGTKVQFDTDSPAFFQHIAAGAGSTVLIGYREQAQHGEAVVGTISGTSVSYGTPATFTSNAVYYVSVAYSAALDKFLITYYDNDNSGYGTAVVATVSGTSVTFGTPVVYESSYTSYNESVYDTNAGAFVSVYSNGTSNTRVIACTVSGTTPTFGSAVNADTDTSGGLATPQYDQTICYDSSVSRSVIAWRQATAQKGRAAVVSVSGTTVTVNSFVQFLANQPVSCALAYDAKADRVVLAYQDVGNSYYGYAVCAEVSSTSLTFGTAVQIQAAATEYLTTTYDETQERVMIGYRDSGNSDQPTVIPTTISGSTISFGSETLLAAFQASYLCAAYNSTEGKILYAFIESGVSSAGGSVVVTSPGTASSLTSTNLLGLAPEAISDTATGTINTWGSRCESSSLLPDSLSVGTAAEVDGTANSVPEAIIYDSNENKVVIPFQNAADSYHAYAAVGTVSGDSISFGSPVEFNNGTTNYMMGCFDSSNNKIVIGYADGSNAYYLTVVVGTVSGSSISFGTPVVAESSDAASYQEMAFDSNANKVVIGWQDSGNSDYGSAIVGTVSGTSISFGTKAAFNSAQTFVHGVTYDSNAQKVVFSYRDNGTGSGHGRSIVGTVSGTGISFGSATTFFATSYSTGIGSGYDSTNNKVIVGYTDLNNSNYGTAVVGTVSGTSISFGTATAFGSEAMSGAFGHYITEDVSAQKIIIAYDGTTSGKLVSGTVSGTDITFDTPIVTDSTGTGENHITYDSNANKTVLTYQGSSVSYKAMAAVASFGTTPLTVTSDYYVQTDGTLSTDTGGQLIGNAIKTNQINIKDYTG